MQAKFLKVEEVEVKGSANCNNNQYFSLFTMCQTLVYVYKFT